MRILQVSSVLLPYFVLLFYIFISCICYKTYKILALLSLYTTKDFFYFPKYLSFPLLFLCSCMSLLLSRLMFLESEIFLFCFLWRSYISSTFFQLQFTLKYLHLHPVLKTIFFNNFNNSMLALFTLSCKNALVSKVSVEKVAFGYCCYFGVFLFWLLSKLFLPLRFWRVHVWSALMYRTLGSTELLQSVGSCI